jgi:2-hydroxy-3-keto-5-methylthiopentenyl-1-phosphate phosphatase
MIMPSVAPLQATDLILCDFDGTISTVDTGAAVMDALDLAEGWEIEHRWRRGEINSMECMQQQWGLVKLPPDELYALIDSLSLDPDFPRLLALARQRQARFIILSDGLDFYIDRMLANQGLQSIPGHAIPRHDHEVPVFANHARVTPEGLELEFPYQSRCDLCGNCKTAWLFHWRPRYGRTIYLGDGHSDFCAARFADLIFARDALAEELEQTRQPYVPLTNLGEVVKLLS